MDTQGCYAAMMEPWARKHWAFFFLIPHRHHHTHIPVLSKNFYSGFKFQDSNLPHNRRDQYTWLLSTLSLMGGYRREGGGVMASQGKSTEPDCTPSSCHHAFSLHRRILPLPPSGPPPRPFSTWKALPLQAPKSGLWQSHDRVTEILTSGCRMCTRA